MRAVSDRCTDILMHDTIEHACICFASAPVLGHQVSAWQWLADWLADRPKTYDREPFVKMSGAEKGRNARHTATWTREGGLEGARPKVGKQASRQAVRDPGKRVARQAGSQAMHLPDRQPQTRLSQLYTRKATPSEGSVKGGKQTIEIPWLLQPHSIP